VRTVPSPQVQICLTPLQIVKIAGAHSTRLQMVRGLNLTPSCQRHGAGALCCAGRSIQGPSVGRLRSGSLPFEAKKRWLEYQRVPIVLDPAAGSSVGTPHKDSFIGTLFGPSFVHVTGRGLQTDQCTLDMHCGGPCRRLERTRVCLAFWVTSKVFLDRGGGCHLLAGLGLKVFY
jgi:hypothetical protein